MSFLQNTSLSDHVFQNVYAIVGPIETNLIGRKSAGLITVLGLRRIQYEIATFSEFACLYRICGG